MNESLLRKGVNGINQLAESIAGSEYWHKVAPGMKQITLEAGERIAKAGVVSTYNETNRDMAARLTARALRGAQGLSTTGEEFDKYAGELLKKIGSPEDIDKIFRENEHLFGGRDWTTAANKAKSELGAKIETIKTPEQAYKEASILTKLVETPKAYFTNPDKDIRNTRIKTAVAGYAAASVGGRYLSGGTLTRDSYGRNDIAGVPFI